jgi:hypothetical protein
MSARLPPARTPLDPNVPPKPGQHRAGRLAIVVLSVLAFAQAALVLATGSGITRIVAVGLALAGLDARLRTMWALAVLIAVNFGVHVWTLPSPIPARLAHVSVLVLYATTALAAAAALVTRVRFAAALAGTTACAVVLIVIEAALPRVMPPAVLGAAVRWIDAHGRVLAPDAVGQPYALVRSVYPDNPRGYFEEPSTTSGAATGVAAHSVAYSMNALGCRGRDYAIPNARGTRRILVLGGGGALGVGVHEPDTFAARLEQALHAESGPGETQAYEVINCGVNDRSTADQRLFFEQTVSRYEPDIVLLAVGERDNLSRRDEEQMGYVHQTSRLEDLLLSFRVLQWARHEGRRPFEYSSAADEVVKLDDACRSRGATLAVVVFRNAEANARWSGLVNAVAAKIEPRTVPFLDLGPAILGESSGRDLAVHAIDPHPNDIAHRAAATAIEQLLRSRNLVF